MKTINNRKQSVHSAGPAGLVLLSIPMESVSLPNSWRKHEELYNRTQLKNRAVASFQNIHSFTPDAPRRAPFIKL